MSSLLPLFLLACAGSSSTPEPTSDPVEGCTRTFYVDADGDGFGDETQPVVACDAPAGASLQAGDCDDTNADASPLAREECDGIDNDCDGTIDAMVPTRFSTLDDAVQGLPDGAEICLGDGRHEGPIDVSGRELTISGRAGTVYALGDGTTPFLTVSGDSDLTLRGGRVEGLRRTPKADGPAFLEQRFARVVLEDLTFADLHFDVADSEALLAGGLLRLQSGGELILRRTTFRDLSWRILDDDGTEMLFIRGGVLQGTAGTVTLEKVIAEDWSFESDAGVWGLKTEGLFASIAGSLVVRDLAVSDIEVDAKAEDSVEAWPIVVHTDFLRSDMDVQDVRITDVRVTATAPRAATGELLALWGTGTATGINLSHNMLVSNGSDFPTRCDHLLSLGGDTRLTDYVAVGNYAEVTGGYLAGLVLGTNDRDTYAEQVEARQNTGVADSVQAGLVRQSSGTLTNAVFAGNRIEARSGGTVSGGVINAGGIVHNVDVVGNEVVGDSVTGGLMFAGGRSDIRNTSLVDNLVTASSVEGAMVRASDGTVWRHNNAHGTPSTNRWSGMPDPTGLDGNLDVDPSYSFFDEQAAPLMWRFYLANDSSLVDAGDPTILDADKTTSDIGAYGGPAGDW